MWTQTELTYGEDAKVREIIRKYVGTLPLDEVEFAKAIDKLYGTNGMKELFQVIIKPSKPRNVLKRVGAFFARKISGVDQEVLLDRMKRSEIAVVMMDFFVLRQEWMQNFLISLTGSDTQEKVMEKATELVKTLGRQLSVSQTETSSMPNE
jgi:hypothetical protein